MMALTSVASLFLAALRHAFGVSAFDSEFDRVRGGAVKGSRVERGLRTSRQRRRLVLQRPPYFRPPLLPLPLPGAASRALPPTWLLPASTTRACAARHAPSTSGKHTRQACV
eukprot:Tamp_26331.p2 GENE.Tamp_26331~~Tamp_26331.p2  ORF type:complete len:112 (+),score=9.20 Tamp_26331:347-682(+)